MLALVMTLAMLLPGSAAAGAPHVLFHAAPDGRSLRGLDAVYVAVRCSAPYERPYGLSEAGLRSEVELVLNANGIRTLRRPEWRETSGRPYLSVNVVGNTLNAQLNDTTFFYTLTLELVQQVQLHRTPALLCDGVTWSEGTTIVLPRDRLRTVAEQVGTLAADFSQAVMEANAGRGGTRRGKGPQNASLMSK